LGGGGFVGGGFGFGWGWHAWGCNWGGGGGSTVIYNHTTYIHNTTYNNYHNTNYNNYHPWGQGPHGEAPYAAHRYDPDGGRNGNNGLIGGRGGVEQRANGPDSGRFNSFGGSRNQMVGDGRSSRMESNRGRYSMNRGRAMRAGREPHRSFGGGGRRR